MIDFTRSQMTQLATHFAGNFGLGEDLILSDEPYVFKNDIVGQVFFNYLTQGFKNDIFYHFPKTPDRLLLGVQLSVRSIFKDPNCFFAESKQIAHHLYKQTMHPKIRGGELYATYIKDVVLNGQLCDAIGIFKSENKETFIKVDIQANMFDIETDLGINPHKLDKGILIFNLEQETGYKAVMVDNSSRISDASFYWVQDFLDMKLKDSPYLHTKNYIEQALGFCEQVLTEENNVNKQDKMMVRNKAMTYFDEKTEFQQDDFNAEVLANDKELVKSFAEHQVYHNDTFGSKKLDNFTINKTAVKQNKKYLASKIKLDSNFEITIHSRHDYIETGFDEEKGLKFYKLYYVNDVEK